MYGEDELQAFHYYDYLTLSLQVTHIRVNFSTVYNDTLVAKRLMCECRENRKNRKIIEANPNVS